MVVDHPLHPSHFVTKLWSYFIPEPPSEAVRVALEQRYVQSGNQIRPIVEAILCSPEFYEGGAMVKPPVVWMVGMLRAQGMGITTSSWEWLSTGAGQRLFYPPDVSGWDDDAWLDTSTTRGRWDIVYTVLNGRTIYPSTTTYQAETAQEAVDRALSFWGDPPLRDDTRAALLTFSQGAISATANSSLRAQRQNALRHLVAMSPDYQTS
jgi:uncharacterized protein (DUF1800 family)